MINGRRIADIIDDKLITDAIVFATETIVSLCISNQGFSESVYHVLIKAQSIVNSDLCERFRNLLDTSNSLTEEFLYKLNTIVDECDPWLHVKEDSDKINEIVKHRAFVQMESLLLLVFLIDTDMFRLGQHISFTNKMADILSIYKFSNTSECKINRQTIISRTICWLKDISRSVAYVEIDSVFNLTDTLFRLPPFLPAKYLADNFYDLHVKHTIIRVIIDLVCTCVANKDK
jgi:hypothetical protein